MYEYAKLRCAVSDVVADQIKKKPNQLPEGYWEASVCLKAQTNAQPQVDFLCNIDQNSHRERFLASPWY